MPIFVVEGMDNTGKTTLVQRLAEELNLCRVSTYCKPKLQEHIWDYDAWLRCCPQPLIMDRHPYVSELVYGSVLNRAPLVTEAQTRKWAESRIAKIIYCRPPNENVLNFGDRPQMGGVVQNAVKLLTMYDMLFETVPHIQYHWGNYEEVKNAIAAYL